MAPLTRSRVDEHGIPGALIVEHYAQRASAGLITSEGVNISPSARGYALTPGIYDDAQIEGWRKVTAGVHARGGRIFPQLWHVGRVSHCSVQPGGVLPVAPSASRTTFLMRSASRFALSAWTDLPASRRRGVGGQAAGQNHAWRSRQRIASTAAPVSFPSRRSASARLASPSG